MFVRFDQMKKTETEKKKQLLGKLFLEKSVKHKMRYCD